MKVFVTGASGFVGRELARQLVSLGHQVTAAVRPTSDLTGIPEKCSVQAVDLQSAEDIARHLEGVRVIFHVAGAVKARSGEDFDRINAGTTAAIVSAADSVCPDALFVLTSSQAASGPCGTGPVTPYGRSKVLAERAVTGLRRYTIVRPPAVFGPEDRATAPLYKWARRGVTVSMGLSSGSFCMISVSDLANFMVMLMDCPSSEGKTLEQAAGRKIIRVRVPGFFVHAAGFLAEIAASFTGSCPMVTREKAKELTASAWPILQNETAELTGWQPAQSPEETLSEAMTYWK